MRVVVTGAAGFIGRALVNKLAKGGVDAVALVRDPSKASYLEGPHVSLLQSDLSDTAAMTATMAGADGVIHAAGSYRIGIPVAERPHMLDANLGTTERVLDAATAANVRRIMYVSTANVFGDTGGQVVDETFRRETSTKQGRFLSYYDETKYFAHVAAERRISQGAPIIIAMPAQVYGPNDHSSASEQLDLACHGKLSYLALTNVGLAWVYVDDLVDGVVAGLVGGRTGQSYVLAGAPLRLGESLRIAARVGGARLPRLTIPTTLLKLLAPLSDRSGGFTGMPANMRETIGASDNVTYWASSAKATKELGFSARTLEQGVRDTWGRAT